MYNSFHKQNIIFAIIKYIQIPNNEATINMIMNIRHCIFLP